MWHNWLYLYHVSAHLLTNTKKPDIFQLSSWASPVPKLRFLYQSSERWLDLNRYFINNIFWWHALKRYASCIKVSIPLWESSPPSPSRITFTAFINASTNHRNTKGKCGVHVMLETFKLKQNETELKAVAKIFTPLGKFWRTGTEKWYFFYCGFFFFSNPFHFPTLLVIPAGSMK